jgi:hypothetical protein
MREANNTDNPAEFIELARISPVQPERQIQGYWFEGNNIKIIDPNSNVNNILRVFYEQRPNYLISEADAGQITSIDTGANTITLSNANASWVSGTTTFDITQQKPQFTLLMQDEPATIAANVLTFTNPISTNVQVGDWVAEANCSPIAQIPLEFQNVLCQSVVVKCLEALNYSDKSVAARIKYEQMAQSALDQISPRANKQPEYLVNRNSLIHDPDLTTWI